MQLAAWVRTKLWRESNWREALAGMCDRALREPTSTAAIVTDLAHACELIEPDRRRAVAMYRHAWQLDASAQALARANELARELGAHDVLAELALAAFDTTKDAAWLLAAGVAFIDAGTPKLAVEPLTRALAARPQDEEAGSALAMIRRETRDPQTEISKWVARAARASRADSARMYLHAARLARIANLDAIYARHLEVAVSRGAGSLAATLLEARLLDGRGADELLAFYRGRLEATTNDRDWADTMRAAGTKLLAKNVQRGLAVRLLRSGLEHAYRARLADVPGHLASWDLLVRHAREARSTRELMPLVVEAIGLPISEDDRLYLARVGFAVSRHDAGDLEAARPYAALIAELVPDDTGVRDFVTTDLLPVIVIEPDDAELRAFLRDSEPSAAAPPPTPPAARIVAPPPPQAAKVVAPPPPPEPANVVAPTPLEPAKVAPPPTPAAKVVTPPPPAVVAPPPPVVAPPPPAVVAPPVVAPPPVVARPPTETAKVVASSPEPAKVVPPPAATRSLIPAAARAALSAGNRPVGLPALPRLPPNALQRAARVVVPVDVEIELPSGDTFAAVVRDLSTTGLFVVTDHALEIGAVVRLELRLPGTNVLSQASHHASAKIVRRADTGYGMLMLEPSRELVAAIDAIAQR